MSTTNHDFIENLNDLKAQYDSKYLPEIRELREKLEVLEAEYEEKVKNLSSISFDLSGGAYTWGFDTVSAPMPKGGIAASVLETISQTAKSARDISDETGLELSQVRSSITALKKKGTIKSIGYGRKLKYELANKAKQEKQKWNAGSNAEKLRIAVRSFIKNNGPSDATTVRNGVLDLSLEIHEGDLKAAKGYIRQVMFNMKKAGKLGFDEERQLYTLE